jgi:hypothetical protein
LVVKVGGLADEGVHHAGIDLCGGGVIDKGDGRAVVVATGFLTYMLRISLVFALKPEQQRVKV